jgi:hypothetical protein
MTTKPNTVPDAIWRNLSADERASLVEHERRHAETARAFGFRKSQVLDGDASDAAAYRCNSWMF